VSSTGAESDSGILTVVATDFAPLKLILDTATTVTVSVPVKVPVDSDTWLAMASILPRSKVAAEVELAGLHGGGSGQGKALSANPFCPDTTAPSRTVRAPKTQEHRWNRSRRY